MKYNLFIGDRVVYRYSVDGKTIVGRVRSIDRTSGYVEVATNISTPQNSKMGFVVINSIESWQPLADKSKLHNWFYMAIVSNRAISTINTRHMVSIDHKIFNRIFERKRVWLISY